MDFVRFQTQFGVVLHPFAALYRLILALRRSVWESGLARRLTPTCPCISVGNIAWGGTGKTPLTDWLMSWAERKSLKTVVLSRGYKADLSVVPVYVKPEHSPREVGDEPLMLGLDHPACAVLVDPDRRRSGAYALQALAPELILLDDGMQHVAVQRNLDMVLLRPVDLQEAWGRVLPEGSWREGASALTRAGVFLIKCPSAQMESLLPEFRARLETLQRPVFSFTLKPCALERLDGGRGEGGLGTRPYALVTGVGNPQQVAQTATEFIGRPPEVHLIFPDHHTYTFKDTARFAQLRMPVVCTRKDAVKLRGLPLVELWALRVEVCFGATLWSARTFPEWLDCWWQHHTGVLPTLDTETSWTGFSVEAGLRAEEPEAAGQDTPATSSCVNPSFPPEGGGFRP